MRHRKENKIFTQLRLCKANKLMNKITKNKVLVHKRYKINSRFITRMINKILII